MPPKSKYVTETYVCRACCGTIRKGGCRATVTLVKDHDPLQGCITDNSNQAYPKAKWRKVKNAG